MPPLASPELAEKMAIAIKPLRRRFKHIEPDNAGNPTATKVPRDWHMQKEAIMNPKTAVKIKKEHSEITEEDKAWELPDVAKAEDITRLPTEPPTDKAIREDVPDFGPTTTVEGLAECVNDVVVQGADGKVTYTNHRAMWIWSMRAAMMSPFNRRRAA